MSRFSTIFLGPTPVALMLSYYLVPFAIVAGAPDSISRLRPFLIASPALLMALGFYQLWWAQRSDRPVSTLRVRVLVLSALVTLTLMAFPQAITNTLAGWAE